MPPSCHHVTHVYAPQCLEPRGLEDAPHEGPVPPTGQAGDNKGGKQKLSSFIIQSPPVKLVKKSMGIP